MEEVKPSLTTRFDELMRVVSLLTEPVEEQFLDFATGIEERYKDWKKLEEEVVRLQTQLNECQKTNRNLELKLKNARHMVDQERARRTAAENDKFDMDLQIRQVIDLLAQGQVVKTKERLQQLQHSFSTSEHYGSITTPSHNHHHHHNNHNHNNNNNQQTSPRVLSTITENHDSVDTILNVSQMDITDEDDLEDSRLRSGRSYKRRSSPERSFGSNKRRSGRRSNTEEGKENKRNTELKTEVTCYTEGDEVRRVKVDIQPTTPACLGVTAELLSPPKKPPRTPAPPPPTPAVHTHPSFMSPPLNYNFINLGTPVTPQAYNTVNTPTHTPHTPSLRTHPSASKFKGRTHAFVLKNAYKIEYCQPCEKRIKFAKACLKCPDCRAICHVECREQVPLPCVPAPNTPNSKGYVGTIADFTPSCPPMVPALVVHCTNEVENRGLSEVGIYRQCGADKDIRELKDQFLRGKGLPNLSKVDIHVITGTLKLFLRSLREPLITTLQWTDFTTAALKTETQDSTAALYQAVSELPQPNRETLAWIIGHLQRVADCPECKMPASNLAKVFGPTLVGYSVSEPDQATLMQDLRMQHLVLEKLLELSADYWNSVIQVGGGGGGEGNAHTNTLHNNNNNNKGREIGGMLGELPRSSRRRSQLFRTPLRNRDSNTLNRA